MIYYKITSSFSKAAIYVKVGDYENIYDRIFGITNDYEEAANVEGWCELASIGEIYEHELFTVEILDY